MIYGFNAGALELLQMPAHLIALVGGGLLLGQQGISHWRWAIPGFVLALVVGMLAANVWQLALGLDNDLILLLIAMLLGVLSILAYVLPRWLTTSLLLVTTFMLGFDTVPIMLPGISPHKLYWTLAGNAAASLTLLLGVMLLAWLLHKLWDGIVVRILGSWLTASALLTLALRLVQKT